MMNTNFNLYSERQQQRHIFCNSLFFKRCFKLSLLMIVTKVM